MATFPLRKATTGKFIRTITGDSFSRAIEAEVRAGRSLSGADLSDVGKYGDPSMLNLAGATLTNVKLDGANLTGAILVGANLSNATAKGATLNQVNAKAATTTGLVKTGSSQKEARGNF